MQSSYFLQMSNFIWTEHFYIFCWPQKLMCEMFFIWNDSFEIMLFRSLKSMLTSKWFCWNPGLIWVLIGGEIWHQSKRRCPTSGPEGHWICHSSTLSEIWPSNADLHGGVEWGWFKWSAELIWARISRFDIRGSSWLASPHQKFCCKNVKCLFCIDPLQFRTLCLSLSCWFTYWCLNHLSLMS